MEAVVCLAGGRVLVRHLFTKIAVTPMKPATPSTGRSSMVAGVLVVNLNASCCS